MFKIPEKEMECTHANGCRHHKKMSKLMQSRGDNAGALYYANEWLKCKKK